MTNPVRSWCVSLDLIYLEHLYKRSGFASSSNQSYQNLHQVIDLMLRAEHTTSQGSVTHLGLKSDYPCQFTVQNNQSHPMTNLDEKNYALFSSFLVKIG